MRPTESPAGTAPFYCIADCCGRFVVVLAWAATWLMWPAGLWGQTAVFTGLQTTMFSTTTLNPYALAADSSGNVFVGDIQTKQVWKIPAGGGAATVLLTNVFPSGMTTDESGNLFVVDELTNEVLQLYPSGGTPVQIGSGWISPVGAAIGRVGDNLYVSDDGLNSVVSLPSLDPSERTVLGTGLQQPGALAVDAEGNLYVADRNSQRVVEISLLGVQTTVVSNINPTAIATDGLGNVFISDDLGNQVLQVPFASSGQSAPVAVLNAVAVPLGLAADTRGGLYIGDGSNHRVVKVPQQTGDFGAVNVCTAGQTAPKPCSQTYTMTFQITPADTPIAAIALTKGAENLDFTYNAANSTCTASAASETCSLNVTFAPKYSGLRRGAIQVFNGANGKLLTTTPIYGTGVGPQIGFTPVVQTVQNAINAQGGELDFGAIAVDGIGNLFAVDEASHQVIEIHADGGAQTTIGTGLKPSLLNGVAVDGAGSVLIADGGNNQIVSVSAQTGAVTTLASGLTGLFGLTVDGKGNIFFADSLGVREITPGGTIATVMSGVVVYALTVDAQGSLYIAGYGGPDENGYIYQITFLPSGQVVNPLVENIDTSGVAVDPAGDVFYTDGSSPIMEIPAGGIPMVLTGGFSDPVSIAIDDTGNLFVTSETGGIQELKRSTPPALIFEPTVIGLKSMDSPQFVAVENIGNSPMVFATPKVGNNPSYPSAFREDTDLDGLCAPAVELDPGGASCTVAVEFAPSVVGTNTGSVVLTDNALDVTNAVQKIAVSGMALPMTPVITWASPAPIRSGTALSGTQLDASANVPGSFVYSPAAGAVLAIGSHTLAVTFTPTDLTKYAKTTVTVNLFVETPIKVRPGITWAAPAAVTYGTALSASQLDATAGVAGKFVYSSGGTAVALGTVLAAGSHALLATFTPTDTTDFTSATAQVTLVVNPAKLTVTATSTSVTYGQALPAFAHTVTGFVHGDTAAVLSGAPVETTTAKSTSPLGSYLITITQGTLKAANYSFVLVNGTLTVKPIGTAAKPVFSLAAGTYAAAQSVTLSDSTPGVVIYYTTNGATPNGASTKYSAAIPVSASETIEAIAVAPGYTTSAVASASYTINLSHVRSITF